MKLAIDKRSNSYITVIIILTVIKTDDNNFLLPPSKRYPYFEQKNKKKTNTQKKIVYKTYIRAHQIQLCIQMYGQKTYCHAQNEIYVLRILQFVNIRAI